MARRKTIKEVLAKGRKPGETLADALRRRLEQAVTEFEEINLHLKRGQMVVQSLTPDLLAVLLDQPHRQKISDAIKAGLAEAKKRGVKLGGARNRPKYNRKRIHHLSRRGFTQQRIAERLGCSQALVSRLLKKEKTKGRKK